MLILYVMLLISIHSFYGYMVRVIYLFRNKSRPVSGTFPFHHDMLGLVLLPYTHLPYTHLPYTHLPYTHLPYTHLPPRRDTYASQRYIRART